MCLNLFDSAVLAEMSSACSSARPKIDAVNTGLFCNLIQCRPQNIGSVIVQPEDATVGIRENEVLFR